MREIIFKAKRKDNGEWVEGYYMPRSNSPVKPKYYIIPLSQAKWYEIAPDTLCQYTGLKDKNGQKLWENDIIENRNQRGKIIYRNCWFKIDWIQYNRHSGKHIINLTQELFEGRSFISIGNIFDNLGLLEV